jgi:hypothetical protein
MDKRDARTIIAEAEVMLRAEHVRQKAALRAKQQRQEAALRAKQQRQEELRRPLSAKLQADLRGALRQLLDSATVAVQALLERGPVGRIIEPTFVVVPRDEEIAEVLFQVLWRDALHPVPVHGAMKQGSVFAPAWKCTARFGERFTNMMLSLVAAPGMGKSYFLQQLFAFVRLLSRDPASLTAEEAARVDAVLAVVQAKLARDGVLRGLDAGAAVASFRSACAAGHVFMPVLDGNGDVTAFDASLEPSSAPAAVARRLLFELVRDRPGVTFADFRRLDVSIDDALAVVRELTGARFVMPLLDETLRLLPGPEEQKQSLVPGMLTSLSACVMRSDAGLLLTAVQPHALERVVSQATERPLQPIPLHSLEEHQGAAGARDAGVAAGAAAQHLRRHGAGASAPAAGRERVPPAHAGGAGDWASGLERPERAAADGARSDSAPSGPALPHDGARRRDARSRARPDRGDD